MWFTFSSTLFLSCLCVTPSRSRPSAALTEDDEAKYREEDNAMQVEAEEEDVISRIDFSSLADNPNLDARSIDEAWLWRAWRCWSAWGFSTHLISFIVDFLQSNKVKALYDDHIAKLQEQLEQVTQFCNFDELIYQVV